MSAGPTPWKEGPYEWQIVDAGGLVVGRIHEALLNPRKVRLDTIAAVNACLELNCPPDELVERVRQTVEALEAAVAGMQAIHEALEETGHNKKPPSAGELDFLMRLKAAQASLALWSKMQEVWWLGASTRETPPQGEKGESSK